MKPVRLGVIFDQEILAGGGYQQAVNAAMVVKQLPADLVELTYFVSLKEDISTLAQYGISATYIDLSKIQIAWMYLRRLVHSRRLLRAFKRIERNNAFERALINHKIDLVYFLSPTSRARDLEELSYITTVWDLCHRDNPEFPETRLDRIFEKRDRDYQYILPRATAIIVDSEHGKLNVVRRYAIDEERVHVISFQAALATRQGKRESESRFIDVKRKYCLAVPYIFYPAQFWAHKNHIYLLEGLKLLEPSYGLIVGAIFAGGDRGNADYVKAYSDSLVLSDRVRFAGFVSNEEIPHLYKQSVALVMPTYFGPTNLPPLEAFELGVPVLYPDKAGLREQVGNAALLMDLKNPNSLALHLKNLLHDNNLRHRLIEAGFERLKHFDAQDRAGVLRNVIEDFHWRRLCWN